MKKHFAELGVNQLYDTRKYEQTDEQIKTKVNIVTEKM